MIKGSISLAYQALQSLYLDNVSPDRRTYSSNARSVVRSAYFHSRATIPSVPVREFCERLGTHEQSHIVLPQFCEDLRVGSPAYLMSIATICSNVRPDVVVETGTYLGLSALIFALNAPAARIYTVDLPETQEELKGLSAADQKLVKDRNNRTGSWYRDTPAAQRITEIRGDSRQLRFADFAPCADIVLIDGGHNYACVASDTENAFDIVRPGGVILWDDYFWLYPDVVRFLDGLSTARRLTRLSGTSLVAYAHPADGPAGRSQ